MSRTIRADDKDFMMTARFAAYVRVSSERQEKEGTVESQLDEIYQHFTDKYPWVKREDILVYKDEGWSGTTLDRPGMDNLLIDLRDDKWDVLVCNDQDRLARDPYLQMTILEEIEEHGKFLDLCTTPTPLADDDNGRMMFEFRGFLAKYERVRTLTRFRIGKLRKARSKIILLSVAPYGYRLVKKVTSEKGVITDSHIVIDIEEAKVVRQIFSWLGNDGLTLRQIAKRLTEEGVKPRRNKYGVWNTSTLGSLARNTTYVGIAKYQTSKAIEPKKRLKKISGPIKNKKTSRKVRPEEDWIEIPVPAILDSAAERELFNRAQEQLIKNASVNSRNKKNDYLLGGLIHCECGSARTGEGPQNGRYLYYRCGSRNRHRHTGNKCPFEGINARIADEAVWQRVQTMAKNPDFLKQQYELFRSKQGTGLSRQIDSVNNDLAIVEKQIGELKDAFVNNVINVHDFTSLKQGITIKQETLQKRLFTLKGKNRDTQEKVPATDLDSVVGIASDLMNDLSFSEKRGIVVRLVDNIVAVPGLLDVTGHIGVSTEAPEKFIINPEVYSPNSSKNHVKHKTVGRNRRTT